MTPADEVTVERLERAIRFTARVMLNSNMPEIRPTLERLAAERDRLVNDGDALEYARRLLTA
jgi:hypothetical protein